MECYIVKADPADGLNRLWQMEKKSGIWTQKMQLRLTKKWVIILDYENGVSINIPNTFTNAFMFNYNFLVIWLFIFCRMSSNDFQCI